MAAIDFNQFREKLAPSGSHKIKLSDANLDLSTVVSEFLKYIFPIAGLILFFNLIAAGFELLTSLGNPETVKKAQGKIFSSLVGFIIIFLSYWLTRILEEIFGLKLI